ncbi:MAG: hypothetical protein LWX11_08700 [Firmicutes bacterium]|nr:hypothetical protein [Bacillota bacterium]
MMLRSPLSRWLLLGLWGTVAVAAFWLMAVQAALALLTPFGQWQKPGIARVEVLGRERDPESVFTDEVHVLRHGELRSLTMLKEEAASLRSGQTAWVLDNYYATPTRPPHFRLTPHRLLLEYPEPLLVLALVTFWRTRKAISKAQIPDPHRPRKVVVDDFHLRAGRFTSENRPTHESER